MAVVGVFFPIHSWITFTSGSGSLQDSKAKPSAAREMNKTTIRILFMITNSPRSGMSTRLTTADFVSYRFVY